LQYFVDLWSLVNMKANVKGFGIWHTRKEKYSTF
jgi:hypothetical protein